MEIAINQLSSSPEVLNCAANIAVGLATEKACTWLSANITGKLANLGLRDCLNHQIIGVVGLFDSGDGHGDSVNKTALEIHRAFRTCHHSDCN